MHAQSFPQRDELTAKLNGAAQLFAKLKLKSSAFWCGKSNAFTLISLIAERHGELLAADLKCVKTALDTFAENPGPEYSLAAKEAVNNKKERLLRKSKLDEVISDSIRTGN